MSYAPGSLPRKIRAARGAEQSPPFMRAPTSGTSALRAEPSCSGAACCQSVSEHPRCARSRGARRPRRSSAVRNIRAARGAEISERALVSVRNGTSALRAEPRTPSPRNCRTITEHPRCARSRVSRDNPHGRGLRNIRAARGAEAARTAACCAVSGTSALRAEPSSCRTRRRGIRPEHPRCARSRALLLLLTCRLLRNIRAARGAEGRSPPCSM